MTHPAVCQNNQAIEQEKAWLKAIAETQCESAFSKLFDRYAPKIKAFILAAQPGSSSLADELVQEVMLKIWQKAHYYQAVKASPSTWIYTLARNARIDHFRKHQKHQSDIDAEIVYAQTIDETQDLFQAAQQKQANKKLFEAIETLSEEQTQVIAKIYMEGKTHQQVSDELQLPLGTVKSRIRLALGKLGLSLRSSLS